MKGRLLWLDIAKGLAILWIVYFHFSARISITDRSADNWNGFVVSSVTAWGMAWLKISGLGLHAVGVFIILNGWALMQSTARRAAAGPNGLGANGIARDCFVFTRCIGWRIWSISSSPFVARWEQVDRRIVLSLLGLRFIDIKMNFYYLNASWWFFSMLIQFYLIFPLLFRAAQRLGPWTFLLVACAVGFFARYLMLIVHPQNGDWILGGFAISRLPEFALGMALGMWHARSSARAEWFFLRGAGLITGLLLYPAALQLYHNGFTYVFVDFATWRMCLLVILGVAGFLARLSETARSSLSLARFSYGIFLTHQPYVIWLGLRIREATDLAVPFIVVATLAVVSAWGIILEKATNTLVQWVTGLWRKPEIA